MAVHDAQERDAGLARGGEHSGRGGGRSGAIGGAGGGGLKAQGDEDLAIAERQIVFRQEGAEEADDMAFGVGQRHQDNLGGGRLAIERGGLGLENQRMTALQRAVELGEDVALLRGREKADEIMIAQLAAEALAHARAGEAEGEDGAVEALDHEEIGQMGFEGAGVNRRGGGRGRFAAKRFPVAQDLGRGGLAHGTTHPSSAPAAAPLPSASRSCPDEHEACHESAAPETLELQQNRGVERPRRAILSRLPGLTFVKGFRRRANSMG